MSAETAYDGVAEQYAALFGSVEHAAAPDRLRIGTWAAGASGDLLDAGCGPGQWTAFLSEQRCVSAADDATTDVPCVVGLDASGNLLQLAVQRYGDVRGVEFRRGDLRALPFADGSFGGVLAWYSLIHPDPGELPGVLDELRRVLRPGGSLLVGCFDGPARESFDHRVTQAWFWDAESLRQELTVAGFEVRAVDRRADAGVRPHLAVEAVRSSAAAVNAS